MISFQNKRVEKINEQIKMAKIQYVKNIYQQKLINLANMQKRTNSPVVPLVNPVVSEKTPLQKYMLSAYGSSN